LLLLLLLPLFLQGSSCHLPGLLHFRQTPQIAVTLGHLLLLLLLLALPTPVQRLGRQALSALLLSLPQSA